MANRYANLPGAAKIKDTYDRINQGFDLVEQDVDQLRAEVEHVDQRVDNIIVGGGPDKDPELVDIRNLDPSYTPQREINVAGDVTRDMQAQLAEHKAVTVNWQRYKLTGDDGLGKGGFYDGDLNDLVDTGIYSVSAATNRPVETIGICIVIRRSTSHLQQMYATVAGSESSNRDRVFLRTSIDNGATWSVWTELIGSNGGTMTGNLTIEGGSGYRRYRVSRNVSGDMVSADIGVNASGFAELIRRVNESQDGVFYIEATERFRFNNTVLAIGTGAPNGAVAAPVGSLYLRTDGGANDTLWVKTSGTGNTGWTAK